MKKLLCSPFYAVAALVTAFCFHTTPIQGADVEFEEEDSGLEIGASLAWTSRYMSEGLDNLDGKSIFSTTLEASLENFLFELWYGFSPNVSYDELELGLYYCLEWDDFEFYAGAAHLRYFRDREHENELVVGGEYSGVPANLALGAEVCYNLEQWGYFAEVHLSGSYEVTDFITLTPMALMGMNQGYTPDGHHGPNHFALSLEARTPLTKSLELSVSASYQWAIDRYARRYEGDDLLKNCFIFGAALHATF